MTHLVHNKNFSDTVTFYFTTLLSISIYRPLDWISGDSGWTTGNKHTEHDSSWPHWKVWPAFFRWLWSLKWTHLVFAIFLTTYSPHPLHLTSGFHGFYHQTQFCSFLEITCWVSGNKDMCLCAHFQSATAVWERC